MTVHQPDRTRRGVGAGRPARRAGRTCAARHAVPQLLRPRRSSTSCKPPDSARSYMSAPRCTTARYFGRSPRRSPPVQRRGGSSSRTRSGSRGGAPDGRLSRLPRARPAGRFSRNDAHALDHLGRHHRADELTHVSAIGEPVVDAALDRHARASGPSSAMRSSAHATRASSSSADDVADQPDVLGGRGVDLGRREEQELRLRQPDAPARARRHHHVRGCRAAARGCGTGPVRRRS